MAGVAGSGTQKVIPGKLKRESLKAYRCTESAAPSQVISHKNMRHLAALDGTAEGGCPHPKLLSGGDVIV